MKKRPPNGGREPDKREETAGEPGLEGGVYELTLEGHKAGVVTELPLPVISAIEFASPTLFPFPTCVISIEFEFVITYNHVEHHEENLYFNSCYHCHYCAGWVHLQGSSHHADK